MNDRGHGLQASLWSTGGTFNSHMFFEQASTHASSRGRPPLICSPVSPTSG